MIGHEGQEVGCLTIHKIVFNDRHETGCFLFWATALSVSIRCEPFQLVTKTHMVGWSRRKRMSSARSYIILPKYKMHVLPLNQLACIV